MLFYLSILILIGHVLFVVQCNQLEISNNNYIVQRADTENLFPLSIIHFNDFHACFEPVSATSLRCDGTEPCMGGYARLVHAVKELKSTRPNPIYLNAGDNFQGTIWYNIGRWNVTSYFLNLLPADAITIGNHEFDNEIEGLVPFLDRINSPIVVCNIDDSEEPMIQGKYQKSTVIERDGRQIGVIGVMLATTNEIAQTGKLKFLNESEAILEEAGKLKANGVDIIIVLSHSGLTTDKEIASICGDEIDVIVGGHSHTFMYNGTDSPGPGIPDDTYPAIVNGVLIVQASAYTRYLGDLTVYFDDAGNVVSYEGAPIFLDMNIPEDIDIVNEMQPWKDVIDIEANRYIGASKVHLEKSGCNNRECNLGSFITDSFVSYYVGTSDDPDEWTYASIAITNVGGIRSEITAGDLDFGTLITAIPFENTLDTLELSGYDLLETLEFSVSRSYDGDEDPFNGVAMLQVSGLKVVYNVSKPIGNRVESLHILCNKCVVPEYRPINVDETYRLIVPSFLASGGDGFNTIRDKRINHRIGPIDIDVFVEYVQKHTPILRDVNNRIEVLT